MYVDGGGDKEVVLLARKAEKDFGKEDKGKMEKINRYERDSLLFYQGGGKKVKLSSSDQNLRKFYDADNAYMVINALLMPGVSNERTRLKKERRQVNLVLLQHMDEILKVYERLYSVMCKYAMFYERETCYNTYRIDRMNSLLFLQEGQTCSFMSTTIEKEKNTDFCDKNGLLLLEIHSPGEIEHVDVNAVLGEESAYPNENEILYAPFIHLDRDKLELTEEELQYRDRNHQPPKAKYRLNFRMSSIAADQFAMSGNEIQNMCKEVLRQEAATDAQAVWKAYMADKEPETEMLERYLAWKEKLQAYIKMRFAQIKCGIMNEKYKYAERLQCLRRDIDIHFQDADYNRQKYEKRVEGIGLATALLYPITTLALALSYIEFLEPWLKAFALIATAVGSVLLTVVKSLAWGEKLQQRTDTFLQLDELKRTMAYEKEMTEEIIDKYVERYLDILREDDKKGRGNTAIAVGNLKSLQESGKGFQ